MSCSFFIFDKIRFPKNQELYPLGGVIFGECYSWMTDFEIELIGLKLPSPMYFSDLFWFCVCFHCHGLSLVEPFIITNRGFNLFNSNSGP